MFFLKVLLQRQRDKFCVKRVLRYVGSVSNTRRREAAGLQGNFRICFHSFGSQAV